MLILPFLLLLVPGKTPPGERERIDQLSGGSRRLALAKVRRERFWRQTAAGLSIAVIGAVAVSYVYARMPKDIDPPIMLQLEQNRVALPIADVDDGNLHRFGLMEGSDVIRFLVLKKSDGSFTTVFDACQICGARGYVQEKHRIVCLNCAADINAATIGLKGGCNPIPLQSIRDGDRLVIKAQDVHEEAALFVGGWRPEVVDPVCRMALRVADAGSSENYKGQTYYFCKMPHCRESFQKDPEHYLKPIGGDL